MGKTIELPALNSWPYQKWKSTAVNPFTYSWQIRHTVNAHLNQITISIKHSCEKCTETSTIAKTTVRKRESSKPLKWNTFPNWKH